MNQVREQMKLFFNLPDEEKRKISNTLSPCHRGYFGIGDENLDADAKQIDLKEGIDIGIDIPNPEQNSSIAGLPNYGPNLWPPSSVLSSFRPTLEAYFDKVFQLGLTLLGAFARALDLPELYFNQFYLGERPAMPILRLLRYPPQPGRNDDAASKNGDESKEDVHIGCGAHSDYGFITILYQDDVGGLELQNSAGAWVPAPPIPGSLVVNIGDMMARITNDVYSATRHRVVNYSRNRERFSIPFFFDPEFHTTVECLPSCMGPDRPSKYGKVMYGEHLMKILDSTWTYRQQEKT
eukprot:TRINITY_DN9635_c0_g1_i4.p1 TRINITY_DN9635_c0_g1~~TRINITY_DN9635_c0_g1_i4.p1  ORF type:complete len:294 (-),score=64.11 TRINITY_DN9635_c0_g1_i4:84-965(-)